MAVEPVDLLTLDMIMPNGMDGADTYQRIRDRCPGQAAILVSGFAKSDRVQVAPQLGAGAYIRKPTTRGRPAAAVRAELDRPHPARLDRPTME